MQLEQQTHATTLIQLDRQPHVSVVQRSDSSWLACHVLRPETLERTMTSHLAHDNVSIVSRIARIAFQC